MCTETNPTDELTDSKKDIIDTLMTPVYKLADTLISEPSEPLKKPSNDEKNITITDYSIMAPFRMIGEIFLSAPDNLPNKEESGSNSESGADSASGSQSKPDSLQSKPDSPQFKLDSEKATLDSNEKSDTDSSIDLDDFSAQIIFNTYKMALEDCESSEEIIKKSMDFVRDMFPSRILAQNKEEMVNKDSLYARFQFKINEEIIITSKLDEINVQFFKTSILIYNNALLDGILEDEKLIQDLFFASLANN